MANVLYDSLFAAHRDNSKDFLRQPGQPSRSYSAFIKQAAQIANALSELGLQPGDRVAVQVNKSCEALALYAACIQSGCIFLPLNTAYTAREVSYFVTDAEPSLIVCDESYSDQLSDVAKKANAALLTLSSDGSGTLMELTTTQANTFPTVERNGEDVAAILYTSGTTGRSKGAMLTHTNLLSNSQTLLTYWQFSSADVLLHALPIYHTHGLFVACNIMLLAGGTMIFLPGFKTEEVLAELPNATTLMGVPTFYTRLLADPRLNRNLVDHMRLFISGSAPLLAETHEVFEQRTGQRILERYGMTETNMNTSNPYDGERKAGTVGFALPGVEIKIRDPQSGAEMNTGDIGVLEVRGPNVFSGYWRMPEKTAEELKEDGFFITGDLAKKDADGYIQIVGRDKDLIISGGFNIYPKELELLLDDQDNVLESAVVAAPHPDFGEGIVAFLVAENDKTIDIERIQEFMSDSLANFKRPKIYRVISELPRNTMGKVQKNALRDQVKEVFAT